MKIGPVALALALLPLLIAAAPKHHKKSLKSLRRQQAVTRQKMGELRKKAHRIRAAAHQVRVDIQSIDQEIEDHMDELAQIAARLKANTRLRLQLKKDLVAATLRLEVRSQQARLRIRQMYMHGDENLASAIVGTASFADLASDEFVFDRISDRDRQLFEEVKELRQNVVDESNRAQAVGAQIKRDQDRQETAKNELEDERQEKGDALQNLKDQEGQIEQLLQELDREEADVTSQIEAYESGPDRYMGAFHGRFLVPVYNGRFSSGFGMRFHPILHRWRMHTGQDIAAPRGTPIHAAADGKVVSCSYMRGYGNAIIIDHGDGYATLYGHCSRLIARPGEIVHRGEIIALVGSTGLATGPHCHFEVRLHGRPVNPMPFLRGG